MLGTERIELRHLNVRDVPRMAGLLNDKVVVKYTERIPYPYNYRDARDFIKKVQEEFGKERYSYAIDLKGDGLVGVVSAMKLFRKRGEIGYWLGRPYWGRGIMTEAVELLLRSHSKDFNLLTSCVATGNIASQKVLQKCGFRKVGTVPNHCRNVFGEVFDSYFYYWEH